MTNDDSSNEVPRDRRPRPQFGELAPEGWTWEPPEQPGSSDNAAPDAAAVDTAAVRPATAQSVPAEGKRPASVWDRPVTLGLLVLGLLGTFFAISILNSLPQAIQAMYTQESLGTYTRAAGVDAILLAGGIVQALLWAVTAALSIWLLVRGRRGFYVPLIGGFVSLILIFVFMAVVLAGDPTLINSIAGTQP